MKSIQYYISKGKLLVLPLMLAMLFTSCDEETNTGASELKPTNPTVTVTGESSVTMAEADNEFFYTITLSEQQIVDVVVYVSQVGGTATEGADFTISAPKVIIPAFSTTASFSIKTLFDTEVEETETFSIQIGDSRTANATMSPVTVNYTLTNVVIPDPLPLNEIEISASWGGDFNTGTGILEKCGMADIDILVIDAGFNILDGYAGATGSCPEESFLDFGALGDGTYFVVALYWEPIIPLAGVEYPLAMDFVRYDEEGHVYSAVSHTQGASEEIITSEFPDAWDSFIIGAAFVVSGDDVTVFSQADAELGTLLTQPDLAEKIAALKAGVASRK